MSDQCVTILTSGDDTCQADADCEGTHLACDEEQCVEVDGAGTDGCTTDVHCEDGLTISIIYNICAGGPRGDKCISIEATCTEPPEDCSNFPEDPFINHKRCHSDNDCLTHLECENQQCKEFPGATKFNLCDSNDDCKDDTYSRCKYAQCIEGEGSRGDDCSSADDCKDDKHLTCEDKQCIEVDGAAKDDCSSADDCKDDKHLTCENKQCIEVEGAGSNDCENDNDCKDDKHLACENKQCIEVNGAGEDDCNRNSDCISVSSSSSTTKSSTESSSSSHISVFRSSALSITISIPSASSETSDTDEDEDESDEDSDEDSDDDSTPDSIVATESLIASAPICGNGTLEPPEECDDANRRDGDGCTSTCLLEVGICGDGLVQSLLGEQCEQATHSPLNPYPCINCLFLSLTCGDGTVNPGEDCDNGALNSNTPDAACRPNCHTSRCGDGVLDSQEICDDGNRLSNDGCDRYCREETQIAAEQLQEKDATTPPSTIASQFQPRGQFNFPQYPNFQQLPYQLPLAQLRPLIQSQGPVGDTGPAAVAVIGAGTAAGFSWIRRKRR